MAPLAAPPAVDMALLSQIVTVSFSQRRKLLRHTLGRWLEQVGHDVAFDVHRRAEEVAVPEFVALAQQVGRRATG
jgi:16S rRNA (adenine1518-N6/adenine1519-N6)-dimethyltransferase